MFLERGGGTGEVDEDGVDEASYTDHTNACVNDSDKDSFSARATH